MNRNTLRYLITQQVEGRDTIRGTVTSMSSNNILSDDLARFPDDYLNDALLYVYSGTGAGEDTWVSDFAATSGNVTPTGSWGTAPVAADLFEVHLPGYPTVAQYHSAIDYAYATLQDVYLEDKIDESLMMERDRYDYPMPSGFRYLSKVMWDPAILGSDRCWGTPNYQANTNLFTAATTNVRLSQAFKLNQDLWLGKPFLYLAKTGTISPARTLTIRIETDSSGLPSGTLVHTNATGTISTSVLGGMPRYHGFSLTQGIFLLDQTTYHLVLSLSGSADATNFVYWGRDDATYGNGSAAAYDNTSWTAISNATFIFSLGTWIPRIQSVEIPSSHWHIFPSDKYLQIDEPQEGRVLRLIGQSEASLMTADTDTVISAEDYITHKAASFLLSTMAKGPQKDGDAMLQRASFHEALANGFRAQAQVQVNPNSIPVDVR